MSVLLLLVFFVYPTLLALSGAPIPTKLEGHSLAPLLKQARASHHPPYRSSQSPGPSSHTSGTGAAPAVSNHVEDADAQVQQVEQPDGGAGGGGARA